MNIVKAVTLAIAMAAAPAAMAQEVTLRMGNWLPPSHHMQETLANWIAAVEEATNGEVTIDLMTTPLAPPPGQYDLVRNGVVDIGYSFAATTPTLFQKFRAIEVPFLLESAEAGSAGLFDWYTSNGFDEEEFEGTHLIAAFVHAPFLIHARETLESLDDLQGMKVRAGGAGIEILRELGSSPVFLSPGDTTEALQRGTVDATQFTWESLQGFRLMDLATHSLEIPDGGLYGSAFWLAMGDRAWNKLSEEQQAAIEGIGIEGSRIIGQGWDEAEAAGRSAAEENGNTIVTLGQDDTEELKERLSFLEEQWVEAVGENGQELLDELRSTIEQY